MKASWWLFLILKFKMLSCKNAYRAYQGLKSILQFTFDFINRIAIQQFAL